MEKLKGKNRIFYVVDWILDIALIIFFLYVSVVVRNEITEKCKPCNFTYNFTNYNFTYNFTGGIR